ncbi:MAG: rhomboid family intramembrane serine protease [Halobacteriovoraceae bacterium]|nr:rhomboid family intramembrane serine protease [Halobacteriovoraceae bacterium]
MWFFLLQTQPYFMINNFLVSWTGLTEGRIWTLITSAFSHNMLFHLFINVYIFFGFGMLVENVIGSKRFLKFYLVAGALGSLAHSVVSSFLLNNSDLPALGASGAVAGVVILFSFMFPKEKILIFGIIPIPAIWGAFFVIGLDIWGLLSQTKGGGLPIGHGAHLGGAATGLIYYFFFLRSHLIRR